MYLYGDHTLNNDEEFISFVAYVHYVLHTLISFEFEQICQL